MGETMAGKGRAICRRDTCATASWKDVRHKSERLRDMCEAMLLSERGPRIKTVKISGALALISSGTFYMFTFF